MDLNLREGYWVKYFYKVDIVMCDNNYYNQFYHPSYKLL
jgi:hypothetical protein